jgi:NAD-dependent dihydropyrimidine dehydrogenase PreA subunit
MVGYISNIYVGIYTVLVGMVITFRQMLRPRVTHQYPYQYEFERKDNYREIPIGYRGQLHNRVEDCIVCNKCVLICPVDCIYIDSRKPSGGRGAKLWESMNVVHLKDRKQIIGIVEGGTKKIEPDTEITISQTVPAGKTRTVSSNDVDRIVERKKVTFYMDRIAAYVLKFVLLKV